MTISVTRREVLHYQDAKADKLYIVEEVATATDSRIFTLWGRRGGKLTVKDQGSFANFFRLVDEKKSKGYLPKAGTVGLEVHEADLTTPLTPADALAAAFTAPVPAAAAPDPDPSTDLSPEALASALAAILDDTALKLKASSIRVQRDAAGAILADSEGTPGLRYRVSLNPPTCDCPWFTGRGTPCKHLSAAAHAYSTAVMDEAHKRAVLADVEAMVAAAGAVRAATAPPLDPIDAIFAPLVLADGGHPLVPAKQPYLWADPTAKLLAAAMRRGKHVLLYGDAGTGKSSLVEDFAARTNRPVLRINMSGQTGPADLVGHYIVADGRTIWMDGALPMAMREGYILLVDEVDMALPEVLALLHPVLEPNGKLMLKEHDGEVIHPHPEFRLCATANSLGIHDESGLYQGANAMNHAFLSRWTCIEKGHVDKDTEASILVLHGISKKVAATVAVAGEVIRKLIHQERRITGVWGVRHSLDFSQYAVDLGTWEEGFMAAATGKFSTDERKAMWEALQRLCGGAVA